METKICTICHKELPITAFGLKNSKTGALRADCKECHSKQVNNAYKKRKQWVSTIKAQNKCAKCGEDRSYLLDFHHIDPSIKDNTVARLTSSSSTHEKILREIDKCVVLCANCHREFHYLEKEKNITIEEYLQYDQDKS